MPAASSRPRLAQRRRVRRRIMLVVIIVAVLVCVGALAWGSHQPRVTIQSITVEGVTEVPVEQVRAVVTRILDDGKWHAFSRRSVFWYPKTEIRAALLEEIPRLELVHVETDGFWGRPTLVATVAEREPTALWCRAAGAPCYVLDAGGFIFAEVPSDQTVPGSTRFLGGFASNQDPIAQYFLPTQFDSVRQLLRHLRDAGFESESFLVTNEHDFDITVTSGMHVYASFEQHPEVVVSNLQTALSADALRGKEGVIEYIDLRFGNRVYFRLEDGTTNEQE